MDETTDIDDDQVVYALIVEDDDELEIDVEVTESELSFPSTISTLEFDSVTSTGDHMIHAEHSEITVVEDEDGEETVYEEYESYDVLLDNDENTKDDDVIVSSFVEKRSAQFQLPKINKRKLKLYSILSVLGILLVSILVLESPIFSIDKVQIVQAKNSIQLSPDELSQLNKDLSSVKDQQMYRSNFELSNNKIGNLTFVKSVNFEKVWPSTVKVSITHRVAVATIKTDKGFVLIDDESVAYAKVPQFQQGLPVFKGFEEITFSKAIADKNYVTIIKSVPVELNGQVAYVNKKESKYSIELTDGIIVQLGDTRLLKEKLAIAWSIILTKNRSELGYIDVSVPSLPVSGQSKVEL